MKLTSIPTRSLRAPAIITALLFSLASAPAAEKPVETPKDVRQLLQEGLFEEEASRDLGKAAAAYSALIAKVDAERALAATAIFRLAEVRAKQGRKDEAVALWQRIVTEFPSQAELVKLSRERLGAGGGPASMVAEAPSDEENKELARLRDISKNSPDLLWARNAQWRTPLDEAASKGWLKVAEFLLAQDGKLGGADQSLKPLVFACVGGHKTMVDFLLDHGAKIDSPAQVYVESQTETLTPLTAAISRDRRAIMDRLLERKAGVNVPDRRQRTPLFVACEKGDVELCKLLLERGADPNVAEAPREDRSVERTGTHEVIFDRFLRRTPLLLATRLAEGQTGRADLLKLLLEHGAKPGLPSAEDACEIEDAIRGENLKALELLLPRVPKLAEPGPLQLAVGTFNPEVLALVIRSVANLDAPTKYGTPLLNHALQAYWFEGASMLLEAGASPKVTDPEGKTPLHCLAEIALVPMAPPLPASKRQGNNRSAPTPVQLPQRSPVYQSSPWAFPLIGISGTEKLEPDSPTVIENAEWAKRRPLFEALLAKGADVNARDKYGRTPLGLFLFANYWSADAVEWFAAKGADFLRKQQTVGNTDGSALDAVEDGMRPELARRVLLPKLAQADTILVWGAGDSVTEPFRFKRDAEQDTPPTLQQFASGFAPGTPAVAKPGADAPERKPAVEPRRHSLQEGAVLAVINRKGADGKWSEAAVVPLTALASVELELPKLQWGDAIFLCASSGGYWRKNLSDGPNPGNQPRVTMPSPTVPGPAMIPRPTTIVPAGPRVRIVPR